MTPIPNIAKPVAAMIAAKVPRPDELPTWNFDVLRWEILDETSYNRRIQEFCPLGLLPGAADPAPSVDLSVGESFFLTWWDNLRMQDAAAAVNAIWGDPPA